MLIFSPNLRNQWITHGRYQTETFLVEEHIFQMACSVTRGSIQYLSMFSFSNIIHPIKDRMIPYKNSGVDFAVTRLFWHLTDSKESWLHTYCKIRISFFSDHESAKSFLFAHLCWLFFCGILESCGELWYQSCGMRLLFRFGRRPNARLEWCDYIPNLRLVFLRYDHVTACIKDHNSKPNWQLRLFWDSNYVASHLGGIILSYGPWICWWQIVVKSCSWTSDDTNWKCWPKTRDGIGFSFCIAWWFFSVKCIFCSKVWK